MIYALVFAAGSTALARTSKALQAETWDALHRYGVYRMHISSDLEDWYRVHISAGPEDRQGSRMDCNYLKNVQNVHLRITAPVGFPFDWFNLGSEVEIVGGPLKTLNRLVKAIEKPKTCHVQLTTITTAAFLSHTLEAIRFRDFERLNVELFKFWHGIPRAPSGLYYSDDEVIDIVSHMLGPKEGLDKTPKVTVVLVNKDIKLHS